MWPETTDQVSKAFALCCLADTTLREAELPQFMRHRNTHLLFLYGRFDPERQIRNHCKLRSSFPVLQWRWPGCGLGIVFFPIIPVSTLRPIKTERPKIAATKTQTAVSVSPFISLLHFNVDLHS